jgi:DNA-binding SARP family transcriptional activator
MVLMQEGYVQCALGRFVDADATFQLAGERSLGAQATPCYLHVHLTRGLRRLRDGAHHEARAELVTGFTHARAINQPHFFRALPGLAAQLCGAALDLDADAAYARKVIATRSFACPDIGIAKWPWPIHMRALGGFEIERDDEPVKFGRKAPKRMLDVLRLIVAFGGRQVDAGRVAATLWPDAEGDEAREALKTILRRARALFGAELLVVREGLLSFNEQAVWADTRAFEHVSGRIESLLSGGAGAPQGDDGELERRRLQMFALYRGHFLGEGEVPTWAIAARDRWRARFVRCAVLLGQRCERVGRQEAAIELYRTALEQDNLAEELYQRLIECHLTRGQNAEALNAYRRCRELLSIVLGLKPSARTDALVARVAGR